MPKVTCFQHIDCEGPGSLSDILRERFVDLSLLRPFAGDPIPEDLGDGLIVLGGPMGVYEEARFPWMTQELSAIRKCLDRSVPVLGICLGSQMLAHAAGGKVFKGEAGQEVGWFPITVTPEGRRDVLLQGLGPSLEVFHWHGDTFTLPEGSSRLAESTKYPNQVFKVGRNAYGFQCHLEVTEPMVRDWMKVYAKELKPNGGQLDPGPIERDLAAKSLDLHSMAQQVFLRFCSLL
jgi:GMP synthase (glutamine-hydrolysing)